MQQKQVNKLLYNVRIMNIWLFQTIQIFQTNSPNVQLFLSVQKFTLTNCIT